VKRSAEWDERRDETWPRLEAVARAAHSSLAHIYLTGRPNVGPRARGGGRARADSRQQTYPNMPDTPGTEPPRLSVPSAAARRTASTRRAATSATGIKNRAERSDCQGRSAAPAAGV